MGFKGRSGDCIHNIKKDSIRWVMIWQITIGYALENIRPTSEKGKQAFSKRETDWDGTMSQQSIGQNCFVSVKKSFDESADQREEKCLNF